MKKSDFKFNVGNVKLGYILVKGVSVNEKYKKLEKEEKEIFDAIKKNYTLENLSKDKVVDSFRKLYWSYMMDPTKTRISSEALVRRIIKGENMWSVNNIVDTLNLVSAKYRLPMGYLDYDTIKGGISVRRAGKDEGFTKIGGASLSCKGNEICVADDEKIVDYGFATSDSDQTKVNEKTKTVLILVYATSEIEDPYLKECMETAKDFLKKVTSYNLQEEGIAYSDKKEKSQKTENEPVQKDEKKQTLGLSAKKSEDFSEWYTQVIQKADMADYTAVSGCIVFKPYSYSIWEKMQSFFDAKIKKSGVKNAYFPLFIPESLLTKEQEHVEGFTPEVAWVTQAGDTKLSERLAVRPTSETIMYDSYSKWIRSYNDLPLRLNQWNNVVRWEFKHAVPFLRTREFLWHEGHTVFATKKEAEDEVLEILEYYREVHEDLLAIPSVKGKKTELEKFAGGDYSTCLETFLPVNKAIQVCTSHHLGQNFSKAFNITFLDRDGEKKYAWQNSWAFTTRSIGIMIITHGDDKGIVLPPKIAPIKAVIVPIIFDKTKEKVLKKGAELKKMLSDFSVEFDDREQYSPGWKFNEWELKGVPLRIELGPKDYDNEQVVIARRDSGKKEIVKWKNLKKRVPELLDDIQKSLFENAKKHLDESIVRVKSWDEFLNAASEKKWIKALHCSSKDCERQIKEATDGVKTNCIPFEQPKKISGKCVKCGQDAKYEVLFAKSY